MPRRCRPGVAAVLGAVAGFASLGAIAATAHAAVAPGPRTPVVMVIFDELPTATLLGPDGKIDARRFPGFAAMARGSTWYPNNTTVADYTGRAVPAILTGTNPGKEKLPVARFHPNSIFSMLGGDYRMHVLEPLTRICAPRLCKRGHRGGERGRGASKSGVIGDFIKEHFEVPDPAVLERAIDRIPASNASFSMLHLMLPHEPFKFLPDGRPYGHSVLTWPHSKTNHRWIISAAGIAALKQRHYLQTGYADRLLSRIVRRLKKSGLWKRALTIVTADHGFSFLPGSRKRTADRANLGGTVNPPLFIRYPEGGRGQVSEVHSRSIDLVPTIAEVLGIEVGYPVAGVPISQRKPGGQVVVQAGNGKEMRASVTHMIEQREAIVKRARKWLGDGDLDRLGPHPGLIGRRVAGRVRHDRRASHGLEWPRRYRVYRPGRDPVPAFVTGTVRGIGPGRVVAVAVNGRVAATTHTYRFKGAIRFGAVAVDHNFRSGRNRVAVYEVRNVRAEKLPPQRTDPKGSPREPPIPTLRLVRIPRR